MKIGIFDSGLGGLSIALAIIRRLPQYNYIYLGDTKRVPYGNRSLETVHEFTCQALDYLFERDCNLIIIACNTASAEAVRRSQMEYLPSRYPDRRVLGVLIPAAEAAVELNTDLPIGVLATAGTVASGSYPRYLEELKPGVQVVQKAAPLLVPLVENGGMKYLKPVLHDYLQEMPDIGSLILGCTHYCVIKEDVRQLIDVPVISQDEVVPDKLAAYLERHAEIASKLSTDSRREFFVTDLTQNYASFAQRLMGESVDLVLTGL